MKTRDVKAAFKNALSQVSARIQPIAEDRPFLPTEIVSIAQNLNLPSSALSSVMPSPEPSNDRSVSASDSGLPPISWIGRSFMPEDNNTTVTENKLKP